jgi:uncharacterized protein YlxW (UPF0749 family)
MSAPTRDSNLDARERKRAQDRKAQRLIRQRTREHIENLERQVAELSKEKEQALKRNSELEAQIAELQMTQGGQTLGGPGHVGIAPAYGTNNYIMPKSSTMKENC